MKSAEQLQKNMTNSNLAVSKMEAAIQSLNAEIERAEGDGSRSRDWVLATVKTARDAALPALGSELKTVQLLAAASGLQRQFWESTPLLLSLQMFDADAANHAQIQMAYAVSLASMPLPLLNLTFQNARGDKNLPLLYSVWLAGVGRSAEVGFADSCDLSLADIELPGQAPALAAIAVCISNRSHAERLFSVAVGQRIDPVRKLAVSREQQVSSRMVAAATGA